MATSNISSMDIEVAEISADSRPQGMIVADLVELLRDSISKNFSVGFLKVDDDEALANFWISEISRTNSQIICAWEQSKIVGSVIITRETRTNGRHRAEFRKLLVHSTCQGRGIGTRLEDFASKIARNSGIKLLYLDSATDFLVAKTYQKWGWVRVGEVPGYAMNPDASLVATTFFYKQL